MSNRKIISRPITALLSCVALVFAMLMVVLAVPMGKASASSGYVPKRTMSITGNSSEAEAKIVMTGGSSLGEGKKLTVKGYFKVTDFGVVNADQGPKVEVGKTVVTGNTDGWVPFEQEYTASDSNWLVFHFWSFPQASKQVVAPSRSILTHPCSPSLTSSSYTISYCPRSANTRSTK